MREQTNLRFAARIARKIIVQQ